jgi:hypothetical protein
MKQKAKELDLQKRAARAGGPKYGSSTGISSNMYSSSSADNKPDVTPTPVSYSTSSSTYVLKNSITSVYFILNRSTIRPSATGKAMKLGTKGKNVESFVDQLKSEGEIVANTVPIITGAGGATAKTKSQSISLPETQKGE